MTDDYQHKAREFRNVAQIGSEFGDLDDAVDAQWQVADEEFDELDEEVEAFLQAHEATDNEHVTVHDAHYDRLAEEMADVLVTIHVIADMLGIDVREAYMRKMGYNMSKTGAQNSDGKVTDDAEIEKPNFGDCYNE